MIEVRSPANQFFDTSGNPLDAGYIYVGVSGANPETSPQAVYWDKDGTIPAAQPIRTLNGYPSRDGAAAKFYTSTKNYSITVKDKRGILILSSLNSDSGVFDELAETSAAASIGYDNSTSGLVADTVQDAIDEVKQITEDIDAEVAALSVSPALINLFGNSAFLINQRGYVSGTPTTTANQYTIDRLKVVVSGESLSWTPSSTYGNRITAPAGGAVQIIEGAFITGGNYACTWGGTGTIQINGVTKAKGEMFTLTANTNVTVRLVGEFEAFVFARPNMLGQFEYSYDMDLLRCKRYYFKTFPYSVVPAQNAGLAGAFLVTSYAAGGGGSVLRFPVEMRATSTIQTFNPSAANVNWRDTTNGVDRAISAALAYSTSGVDLRFSASAAGAAFNLIHVVIDCDI